MNTVIERTVQTLSKLDEAKQLSVYRFAVSLANSNDEDEWLPYQESEMKEDIRLYDEAKANDDGYRISAKDLRRELGV